MNLPFWERYSLRKVNNCVWTTVMFVTSCIMHHVLRFLGCAFRCKRVHAMPKLTKDQLIRQMTHCPMRQRRGQQLPRCFDCVRNSGKCCFKSTFTCQSLLSIKSYCVLILHLADKRLHSGMRDVEFDFMGSTKPPTYWQRMDRKDTLKSIHAKMVSPSLSWRPLSHCCIWVCPPLYPRTSTPRRILARHF